MRHPSSILVLLLLIAGPAAAQTKGYDRLRADLAADTAGGIYRFARPFRLAPGQDVIGRTEPVTLINDWGTCILHGMPEPEIPPDCWRPDGGLHLRANGRPLRLAYPHGAFSYPGTPPGFYSSLLRFGITVDFALANYGTNGQNSIVCGNGRTVRVIAQNGGLMAFLATDAGPVALYYPRPPGGLTPGSRHRLTLDVRTPVRGPALVSGDLDGDPAASVGMVGHLASGEDAPWQIGECAENMVATTNAGENTDLTLYGFAMRAQDPTLPDQGVKELAATLPRRNEWWGSHGAILWDSSRSAESWGYGSSTIKNVKTQANGPGWRDSYSCGAGIAIGASQVPTRVERLTTDGGTVGVGSEGNGVAYPVYLDDSEINGPSAAAIQLDNVIGWGDKLTIRRPGRAFVEQRNSTFTLARSMLVPGYPLPCNLNLYDGPGGNGLFIDKSYFDGEWSEADYFLRAVARPDVPGGVIVAIRDSYLGYAGKLADLVGTAGPGEAASRLITAGNTGPVTAVRGQSGWQHNDRRITAGHDQNGDN